jgi:hypothetical protein
MPKLRNVLGLLACLPACGGGGGEASVATALRLALDGMTLPAIAQQGTVTLHLAEVPAGSRPVLIECDVVVDPPLVRALATGALQAQQALATLDGQQMATGFHVLCGDAQHQDAQPLAAGALFHLALEATSPRTSGEATVSVRNRRVVDAAGDAVPVDGAPVPARVVVHLAA